jgi:hypothetical protein
MRAAFERHNRARRARDIEADDAGVDRFLGWIVRLAFLTAVERLVVAPSTGLRKEPILSSPTSRPTTGS